MLLIKTKEINGTVNFEWINKNSRKICFHVNKLSKNYFLLFIYFIKTFIINFNAHNLISQQDNYKNLLILI